MQRSRLRKLRRADSSVRARSAACAARLVRHAPIAAAIMAAIPRVYAQTQGQPQAQVQTQAEETGGLQEVVVTAEKRTESLQQVPISVTALDTQKLEQLNLQNFNDYAQALPEVSFQNLQPGFARTFMRGIVSDNNPNHSGPLPSVGTYLDEQPITTIQGPIDVHIYDIARIEVLPGPQGTLYGASSEAGTVRIITNKPDTSGFKAGYDLQGNTVQNGTFGGIAEGFVNIPLSSAAAVRMVGWYERDSGYIDNVHGTLTYPGSGYTLDNAAQAKQHYNDTETYGARAALRVNLDENWTITPTLMAQKTTFDGIYGEEEWKDLATGSPVPNDLAVKHFYPEGGYDDWLDAALTVEGKIGNFDLTYAGAYLRRTDHTDSDYSDYTLGYQQYASYWPPNSTQLIYGHDRYQMYSNELRLSSPQDWPVRFLVGLFQQRQQHGIEQRYVINGLDPAYWIGWRGDASVSPRAWLDSWWLTEQVRVNRDYAAFGELNWDILSNVTATVGIRRFRYDNTLDGFYGFNLNAFGTNPTFAPPSTLAGPIEGEQTCFNDLDFHGAPCMDLAKRTTGSGWTPKFNLAWRIDHDRMVYATYSKGFRPGGINRVGAAEPYAADFLKNYEVGWKTSWFDNHLRFNGAFFYEDWTDFQFAFLGPNSVTIVANAGAAKVKGAETEIEWAATPRLNVTAGAAYIDAYLSENYCGALDANGKPVTSNPCPANESLSPPQPSPYPPFAPAGQQLPTTPRFKGNLGARYTMPIGSVQAFAQGNVVYQSAVWASLLTLERGLLGQQGAYAITNLFIGIDKDNWELELLIKNAFDRRASQYRYAECTEATCAPIAVYNVIATPRTVGVQFSQRFQ